MTQVPSPPEQGERRDNGVIMYRLGSVETLAARTAESLDRLEKVVTRMLEREEVTKSNSARLPALVAAWAALGSMIVSAVAVLISLH